MKFHKSGLSRREFLRVAAGGSLGLSLPMGLLSAPFKASARALEHSDPHFFVFVGVLPTLDSTLGLDPQAHWQRTDRQTGSDISLDERDVYLEYSWDTIMDTEARCGMKLGPACQPLFPWAEKIAVINGIHMNTDLQHTLRHICTGDQGGSFGSLAFAFERELGLPGSLGLITSAGLSQFNRAPEGVNARSPRSIGLEVLSGVEDGLMTDREALFRVALRRIQDGTGGFSEVARQIVDVRDQLPRFRQELSRQRNPGNPEVIATAFRMGLAKFAQVLVTDDLDTHRNHSPTHRVAQARVWSQVAELFSIFSGIRYGDGENTSLFDYTTFMVAPEMSRTPYLNMNYGKDHNFRTNSVLLAGRGIETGKVFGRSVVHSRRTAYRQEKGGTAIHIGSPFDFAEGKAIDPYEFNLEEYLRHGRLDDRLACIRPVNVVKTVAEVMGLPLGTHRDMESVPSIPGVVKEA